SEDAEFLFRMLLHGAKLQFVPDCLVLYRLHTMGQITASGTTQRSRITDWANCLTMIDAQLTEKAIQVDSLTAMLFQNRLWNALKEFNSIQVEPQPSLESKLVRYSPLLKTIYKTINLSRRIEAHIRGRITGSRYIASYQAAFAKESQLQLIKNMGYEPVSSGPSF
ncbi:MAG: hypothetical protein WCA35_16230, partial [Kovacikia sp.]